MRRLLVFFIGLCLLASSNLSAQVDFVWTGAVTDSSARIKARTPTDGLMLELRVSSDSTLTNPTFVQTSQSDLVNSDGIVDYQVTGLAPISTYYYGIFISGVLDSNSLGLFKTFSRGHYSFTCAFASCSWTGSVHPVFTEIKNHDPLFFLHLGDMHYNNIGVNDRDVFRSAFKAVLNSAPQRGLYQSVSMDYIWDDHDFGPNNSDSTAPGREASRLTYREYFPHYPLVEGDDTAAAVYHTFDVGRLRFIVCDSRSARSPAGDPDNAQKTMLGETQKAWFKDQLLYCRDNNRIAVWVNTLPWIGNTGDDGWYLYTNERTELGNFIRDNQITRLMMLSGDAHMLAIDNGTNSNYADSGGVGFPVMHAAPLERLPSEKGGPYSEGAYPDTSGQFGTMSVTDLGDSVHIHWQGWKMKNLIVEYEFGFGMPSCDSINWVCGDVNSDATVDLQDGIALADVIFYHTPEPCPDFSGDVDGNGRYNINDIVLILQSTAVGTGAFACPQSGPLNSPISTHISGIRK